MPKFGSSFNANNVEPMQERGLLPKGDYVAWIVDSEMKETSTGGEMLKLEFDILEGEYKGRKLWTNLNLVNKNPVSVKIAQGELSSICRAVNVMEEIDESEPLHTIPMIIGVAIEVDNRDEDKYKANPNDESIRYRNVIKKYKPMSGGGGSYEKPAVKAPFVPGDGSGRTAAGPRAAASAGAGASTGARKPWEK